jgi:hypothetical protein
MFEDWNFGGDKYVDITRPGTYDIDWWNGDNEITSVSNATGMWIILYDYDDCTGAQWTVQPYTDNADLPDVIDDDAECFRAYYGV